MENKPVETFKAGAILASVFVNEIKANGKSFTKKSISIRKNYKDRDDNWQSTNSYDFNDLPKLAIVARQAYEHLLKKEAPDGASLTEEENAS